MEPQVSAYSKMRRIKDAISQIPAILFSLFNVPGFVRPIDYPDRITGEYIKLRVTRRFTILPVNNREYWFRRLRGAPAPLSSPPPLLFKERGIKGSPRNLDFVG